MWVVFSFFRSTDFYLCQNYGAFMIWNMLGGWFLKTLVREWFFFSLSYFFGSRSSLLSVRGRWCWCLHFCKYMSFKVYYVFSEENHYTHKLANLDLIHRKKMWVNILSSYIYLDFFHNMYSFLCFIKYNFYYEFVAVFPCFVFFFLINFHTITNNWWVLSYYYWDVMSKSLYCLPKSYLKPIMFKINFASLIWFKINIDVIYHQIKKFKQDKNTIKK